MSIEAVFDGRLGGAPQSRTSAGGKPFTSFSVAVGKGEGVEWVSVACFDEVAAELPRDLLKGERVYVEGKLSVWRRDGKATLSVAATKVVVLDRVGRRRQRVRRQREREATPEVSAAANGSAQASPDDPIPF